MNNINHQELSFPALLKTRKGTQIIWQANQAFDDYFPELITNGLANPLYSHIIKNINEEKKVHWKGILYHVDVLHPNKEDSLYLLSPSKDSVSQSFLWLKHDLTNILNPILGFSDMMSNDEKFDEEDHLILQKINENSLIMFQQFQRISQLQKIGQLQVDTQTGSYSLRNYLSELSDKLLVDNDLSTDAEINIENACLVPDFITLHQFRSVMEDQLSYFCKQQKQAKLCIRTHQESEMHGIYFHFPHCQLNPQILETFTQIEDFVSGISPLQKLQVPSLNYLLLCELTKLAGGKVSMDSREEEVILKVALPLKVSQEDIQKSKNYKAADKQKLELYLNLDQYPEGLVLELKEIWKNFNGLMILDQWEALSLEMEKINKKYKNKELEERIQSISQAVKSFDVETLKVIYDKCSVLLKKNHKSLLE